MGYNTSVHEATGYAPFELTNSLWTKQICLQQYPQLLAWPAKNYLNFGKTENIYRKPTEHSKKIKLGINDSKMHESSKHQTRIFDTIDFKKLNINTLISLCKISVLVHSNCLTYYIIVPLLKNEEWTLKKAYPIPRKR